MKVTYFERYFNDISEYISCVPGFVWVMVNLESHVISFVFFQALKVMEIHICVSYTIFNKLKLLFVNSLHSTYDHLRNLTGFTVKKSNSYIINWCCG